MAVAGVAALVAATVVLVVEVTSPRLPGQVATGGAQLSGQRLVDQELDQAAVLADEGKVVTALGVYQTVLSQDPAQPTALAESGWLEWESGSGAGNPGLEQRGRAQVAKAVSAAPSFYAGHLYLGTIDYREGDAAAAVGQYRLFLADHPPSGWTQAVRQPDPWCLLGRGTGPSRRGCRRRDRRRSRRGPGRAPGRHGSGSSSIPPPPSPPWPASAAASPRRWASSGPTSSRRRRAAAGWTVADVLRHGVWADDALRRTWAGDRSLVEGFDPRRTPDEFVRAERAVPDAEVAGRFCASSAEMVAELESAGPDRFGAPALSPIGDVPWWLAAVHLGWDAWIHERDVLVPLGLAGAGDPSEANTMLAYGLVLASFFAGRDPLDVAVGPVRLRRGGGTTEAWAVGADDGRPGTGGAAELSGDPAATVDALSGRGRLPDVLAGAPEVVTRLGGMARYFAAVP